MKKAVLFLLVLAWMLSAVSCIAIPSRLEEESQRSRSYDVELSRENYQDYVRFETSTEQIESHSIVWYEATGVLDFAFYDQAALLFEAAVTTLDGETSYHEVWMELDASGSGKIARSQLINSQLGYLEPITSSFTPAGDPRLTIQLVLKGARGTVRFTV